MIKILKSDADTVTDDFAAAVEQYRQALLDHRFSEPAHQHIPAILAVPPQPAIKPTPAMVGRKGQIIKPGKPGRAAIPGKPARPAIAAHFGTPKPVSHPLIEGVIGRVQTPGKPDDFVILPYEIVDDSVPDPTPRQKQDKLLAEIQQRENEKINAVLPQGKVRLLTLKYTLAAGKPEAERSDEEKTDISSYEEIMGKMREIQTQATHLLAEVEDLTEENIDTWEPKF